MPSEIRKVETAVLWIETCQAEKCDIRDVGRNVKRIMITLLSAVLSDILISANEMKREETMKLPEKVEELIHQLNDEGYSAYAVGGCIRDSLIGLEPNDWDICTNAMPEDMLHVFKDYHVIETGLKHGTVTVMADHTGYEITTFRIDGEYTDHRHPDSVNFVDRLELDLARRDFTVNAMAYSEKSGLIDLFAGRKDLEDRVIRCVGDPFRRFDEDALRILRAIRFAANYDMVIDDATGEAIRSLCPSLKRVSPERVNAELVKTLTGKACGRMLREYPEVFFTVIPELRKLYDLDQKNEHHLYNAWEHTVRAVENIEPTPVLRLTMLLHDTGKPYTMTIDEKGEGHFPGHGAVSAEIAGRTMEALRFDRETIDNVVKLVEAHDISLPIDKHIMLRRLNRFGEENIRRLIRIKEADRKATGTRDPVQLKEATEKRLALLDEILAEGSCFTLRDLEIDGHDIAAMGMKGKQIGQVLRTLLENVMDGKIGNTHEELICKASEIAQGEHAND